MKDISLFHDSFNIHKTSTYHISLQLSKSGYSYCIIDTIRKQYVALKYSSFKDEITSPEIFFDKVKDFLKNDAFLNKNYKSVDFIFVSRKYTLIPNELFDKNVLKSYFQFNQVLDIYDEIHFNRLSQTEAYNVFTIPSHLTTMLVNKFPEIKFFHQGSSLIENFILQQKQRNSQLPAVLLNLTDDYLDVVAVQGTKLYLYNTFTIKNETDFLYYLVNVMQQTEFSPSKTEIFLTGDILEGSVLQKKLIDYMPNLHFIKLNSEITYHFKDIPEHLFSTILDLQQCE